MFGAHRVSGDPYPLSPTVAVAEQSEDLNAHTTAAAKSAAAFKRFAVTDTGNESDRDRMKQVRNGDIVGVDNFDRIKEMQMGGVSADQYRYIQESRDNLNRTSGLTEALRGQISRGSTATESAIADAGTQVRVAGLKRAYRQAVNQVFRSAAWFYFYGEDMIAPIGKEGERYGITEFRGGVDPGSGREEWNFFELSMKIDTFSMEHTDQAILQKRTQDMMQVMVEASGVMPERPWVNWREPMRHMFEVINIGDADEWFDWDALDQYQQMILQSQMPPQPEPGQPEFPPAQSPAAALPNPGTVGEAPYQRVLRGAMQGNIAGEAANLA